GKVVEFPVLPTYSTSNNIGDEYMISINGAGGRHAEAKFYIFPVGTQKIERILVVPVLDAPGKKFDVYYVNFPMDASLKVSLYGEDNPKTRESHPMVGRISWTVTITNPMPDNPKLGWAMETLTSEDGDSKAGYAVYYSPLGIKALFWLH
ncbi:MAG: hypothetical protein IH586_18925, partial [Anaerolineaceae bacterium]|nr:hypothetical protein [Anaerolineaceae bacterium]